MLFRGAQDPDTCRTVDFLPVKIERTCKLTLDPIGYPGDLFRVISSLDKDHEFVAAESGNDVRRAHTFAKSVGDADEELVADKMAEAVVYELESVEIDEQNAHLVFLVLSASFESVFEPAYEKGPVRKTGERIVSSLVLQLLLRDLFIGDVLELENEV